ncbi:uncharacterized protein PG998_013971 [Apiospora kogelbergensis]|uniref:Uncharacterized protein n=1 Tax=Apiospora kogelbergensis TaxID=1337665 RepID=A0AAW0QZW3_9PEZI
MCPEVGLTVVVFMKDVTVLNDLLLPVDVLGNRMSLVEKDSVCVTETAELGNGDCFTVGDVMNDPSFAEALLDDKAGGAVSEVLPNSVYFIEEETAVKDSTFKEEVAIEKRTTEPVSEVMEQ